MLDTAYIQELSEMTKKREAKDALFDYAKNTFNITLKKNLQFEEMVEELKTQIETLASEPMPEQNEGLSITDLIDATDTVEDTKVFANEEPAKEHAIELVSQAIQTGITSIVEPKITTLELRIPTPVQEVTITGTTIDDDLEKNKELTVFEEVQEEPKSELFELPDNYSPSLTLLGSAHTSYATLPWWIYEWITQNPDWKANPNSFPHHYGVDTLLSLIYYIKRDGFVRIRETRNSRFFILE